MLELALPYVEDIRKESEFRFGIPAPVPVVAAQLMQESGFKPDARSPVGAVGIGQFMPATWTWAAKASGADVGASPLDPRAGIKVAVWYDRFLYDRVAYAIDPCNKWLFALSAYNGGERRVQQRQALSPHPGEWEATHILNPGITESNQRENAGYPRSIIYKLQPEFRTLGPLICAKPPPPAERESAQPEGLIESIIKKWHEATK